MSAVLLLLRLLLALLILFEEWGWEPLQRAMAKLARLPVLRQIDALIARLPPYPALMVFFLPGLLLLPVKLGAMWLMTHGHYVAGLLLIIAAKVGGTAIAARIFMLTRPALMSLDWFARLFDAWIAWKGALLTWVHGSATWGTVQAWRQEMRRSLARMFGR